MRALISVLALSLSTAAMADTGSGEFFAVANGSPYPAAKLAAALSACSPNGRTDEGSKSYYSCLSRAGFRPYYSFPSSGIHDGVTHKRVHGSKFGCFMSVDAKRNDAVACYTYK